MKYVEDFTKVPTLTMKHTDLRKLVTIQLLAEPHSLPHLFPFVFLMR